MINRIVLPLLLAFFIGNTSVVEAWSFRSKKKESKTLENEKDKVKEEIKAKLEEAKVDAETKRVMEHNEKYQQQRAIKTAVKENDGKSEEEKKQEQLEIQKINQKRENKEIQADKFLAKGVAGDELVGEEFTKWSAVKAKMSSKDFKRMYLENLKMKRILQRFYASQKGNEQKNAKVENEKKIDVDKLNKKDNKKDEEIFYIYGNYEDEAGELSGDRYIKWSNLKSKTTSLQFRSLVKRNKFLQARVRKLMNENRALRQEIETLKIKNKKLLRG